jgi:hypothetical protein
MPSSDLNFYYWTTEQLLLEKLQPFLKILKKKKPQSISPILLLKIISEKTPDPFSGEWKFDIMYNKITWSEIGNGG